jgi:cytochrome c oxidase cbb3-type subunit 4
MEIDMGVVRGLLSATLLVLFLGVWAWSWSRKRQVDFDAAANMPLEDDSRPPAKSINKEQTS